MAVYPLSGHSYQGPVMRRHTAGISGFLVNVHALVYRRNFFVRWWRGGGGFLGLVGKTILLSCERCMVRSTVASFFFIFFETVYVSCAVDIHRVHPEIHLLIIVV